MVLGLFYRATSISMDVAGISPIDLPQSLVENVDVSDVVNGHTVNIFILYQQKKEEGCILHKIFTSDIVVRTDIKRKLFIKFLVQFVQCVYMVLNLKLFF
jgi:hypothetical protein